MSNEDCAFEHSLPMGWGPPLSVACSQWGAGSGSDRSPTPNTRPARLVPATRLRTSSSERLDRNRS